MIWSIYHMTLIKLRTKRFTVCDIVFVRKHIKTTFGRQWGYHTITGRLQIPTRASRQKFCLARVFPLWRPVWTASEQDNWQIRCSAPNKDEGRHHRKRTSALTNLRRTIRRCNFSFNKKISRAGQNRVSIRTNSQPCGSVENLTEFVDYRSSQCSIWTKSPYKPKPYGEIHVV